MNQTTAVTFYRTSTVICQMTGGNRLGAAPPEWPQGRHKEAEKHGRTSTHGKRRIDTNGIVAVVQRLGWREMGRKDMHSSDKKHTVYWKLFIEYVCA
ncbi:hypothetical protein F2P81_002216 [Scophthalmus maximus]|uniref:Uncharacterized protein n=1 Tax=Scophthalmus maximus TaxID=52904 RepID=A0A6A4TG95_SCOMX|nr:hypothetical protein F2P81_002216 [Scophthalmus maximus]